MYSMSHTHRLFGAVCGALCLGAVTLGAQGLGRQPARYSAAIPATTPTIAPIVSEATSTSDPAQVTTPTTEATPETTEPTTPETVPVTRPRPTVPPRTIPPVIEPDESWAIPAYIVMCESRGRWDAYNPSSGASGPYQLIPAHFGGALAMTQSHAAQHAKAAELWAGGRGRSNWQACL